MCIAIPGKIIEIRNHSGTVLFSKNVSMEINLSLIKPKIGKWVLVHAGFAIETITLTESKNISKLHNLLNKFNTSNYNKK